MEKYAINTATKPKKHPAMQDTSLNVLFTFVFNPPQLFAFTWIVKNFEY